MAEKNCDCCEDSDDLNDEISVYLYTSDYTIVHHECFRQTQDIRQFPAASDDFAPAISICKLFVNISNKRS